MRATGHPCRASIARATNQTLGWSASPDRDGRFPQRVVAGQLLTGEAALDPLRHALGQLAGLHQVQIQRLNVAEVEEVALPLDELVGVEPKPAPADPVDLLLAAVPVDDDLLPETDDLTLAVVDEDLLVRVLPVPEAFHFQTERDVADLVDPDAHHVFLGPDVPAIRGFGGIEAGQRLPVA